MLQYPQNKRLRISSGSTVEYMTHFEVSQPEQEVEDGRNDYSEGAEMEGVYYNGPTRVCLFCSQ